MANIKDVILQKKIEGVLYDLMLRTRSTNVIMGDGRTLAAVLAEYATASEVDAALNNRINELVAGAPAATAMESGILQTERQDSISVQMSLFRRVWAEKAHFG